MRSVSFSDKSINVLQRLFECAQEKYYSEFKQILRDFQNLDIISAYRDDDTTSFLITFVTNRSIEMVKYIMNYIQGQIDKGINEYDQSILVKYLNMSDRHGFTAMHIASFNGDIQIIEYLIEKGADIYVKNPSGLSVMHTAAQGDSPLVLYFFKELGFEIDEPDDEDKTPLYWAVFSNSEYAATFLIAWGADVNRQDVSERQTALHKVTETRIARRLLIAGADKNILDKRGYYPYETAEHKNLYLISDMLRDQFSLYEFCNLRLPLSPPRQKKRMLMVFTFLAISIILGTFFFVLPYEDKEEMSIGFYSLSVLNLLLLYGVSAKNPGYFKEQTGRKDMLEIFKKYQNDYSRICPECDIVKPERSKHCYFCQRCVKVYDHHCPWINNCNICQGQTQLERYVNKVNSKYSEESTRADKEMEDSFKLGHQTMLIEEESQNGTSFLSGSNSRSNSLYKSTSSNRSMLQNCADMLIRNSKNPKYEENSVL